MVDAGGWHHLLLSRGDYGRCGYRTVWRRSASIRRDWQSAAETVLLDRRTTGICGPGGADYVALTPHRLFVHGWVCDGANGPCEASYSSRDDVDRRGHRVLYLARLRWTRRRPRARALRAGAGVDAPGDRAGHRPARRPESGAQPRPCGVSQPDGSGPPGTICMGFMSSWTT